MTSLKLAAAAATAIILATPALAQKAQDTLRVAFNNAYVQLSNYDLPVDEALVFSHDVYDFLLSYDERNKKFVPELAKSWKRVDDKTLEFELRDDIKFHNGNSFGADDVKATIDYVIDPKSKITFVSGFNWVKEVEVLGPHRVRIRSHDVLSTDLATLAYRFQMWDGKVRNKMDDRGDYSRLSPIGTGPYKVTQIDRNKGIIIERSDTYNTLPPALKKANIKRIHGIPVPDRETQVAQMLTGGLDLLRNVAPDTAKELGSKPGLEAVFLPSMNLNYVAFDSVGLSGNKALQDPRVRRALSMAVDREAIIKHIVPGGEVAEHLEADCFKNTNPCKYTVKAPTYDPEGAKKLLAEAGYPNGLDLHYLIWQPNKPIGEAVAGEWHKIGVRVTLQAADISLYRRIQGDGKLQAWTVMFPTGIYPDASNLLNVMFAGPAGRYFNDPIITDGMKAGLREFDPAKREEIYMKVYNRINEMSYHMPISSIPHVYVHTKDVKINDNKFSVDQKFASDYSWK